MRTLRSKARWPLLLIALTLVAVFVLDWLQPAPPVKSYEEKQWRVETVTLKAGALSPQMKLLAQVDSPYVTTMKAGVEADVLRLPLLAGQHFSKGETLLVLDDRDAALEVEQQKAVVDELQARIRIEERRHESDRAALVIEKKLVSLARKKLAREEATSQSKLTSLSSRDSQQQALEQQRLALAARQLALDNHPARLAQLQAGLRQQQARLASLADRLQRTRVIAPYDGVVLETQVAPGERVQPSQPLLRIAATAPLLLRARLPSRILATVNHALTQGEPLHARLTLADGEVVTLRLQRLSGEVDSHGGVEAFFVADGPAHPGILLGDTLALLLTLPAQANSFQVPVSSLYGTRRVYRVVQNRLQTVAVTVAGYRYEADGDYLVVRSERLRPGDQVVATQLPNAVNGLKVMVKP